MTDLAIAAGFDASGRGYISKLEHGQIRRAADARLEQVAHALGVSSVDLLIGTSPPLTDEAQIHGETTVEPLDTRGAVEALRRGLASEAYLRASKYASENAAGVNTSTRDRTATNPISALSALDEDRIAQAVETLIARLEVQALSQLHRILHEQLKPQILDLLNQMLLAREAPNYTSPHEQGSTGPSPTSGRPRQDAHKVRSAPRQ